MALSLLRRGVDVEPDEVDEFVVAEFGQVDFAAPADRLNLPERCQLFSLEFP